MTVNTVHRFTPRALAGRGAQQQQDQGAARTQDQAREATQANAPEADTGRVVDASDQGAGGRAPAADAQQPERPEPAVKREG